MEKKLAYEELEKTNKELEEKLQSIKAELRKLSSAVTQSIDGIVIGDLESRLTYVNDVFAKMHGYSPKDMIGMQCQRMR